MKKTILLCFVLFAFLGLNAQWVNNPATNTFLSNTSADAGEIYLSTSPNGDVYVQWSQFVSSGGWGPKVQRINAEGVPQWDANGLIPCAQYALPSWSQGFAMAATTDNAVVSSFATEAGHTVAVKINADGTYAWGEGGITLFGGAGNSRTELLAGDDGGVWALGTDVDNGTLYLCYIEANGTLNPTITISDDSGKLCMFGLLVPTNDGVFVVYEKEEWAYTYFYEKDIRVVGYRKDGTQLSNDVQLMAPVTIGGSYTHYVVPDGLGGGYAYIWHPAGQGGTFNTYVFHFNQNGVSTILDPNGVAVHSVDAYNYYIDAYATVDPVSHDLIIVYEQTDKQFQQESRVYANRFNTIGDRLWNEGVLIVEENGQNHSNLLIDAFDYGGGYCVVYAEGDGYNESLKAIGIDDQGSQVWNTVMSSNSYPRAICRNTTEFHNGMNVVAWVNSSSSGTGGIYGQNIGWDGTMGPNITPPTPPMPCDPPTNFTGSYYAGDPVSGPLLSWDAPDPLPLHYNLYREGAKEVIELDAEWTSYFEEVEPGDYIYRLTAVYEGCESTYALTETGDDYVLIEVPNTTSVDENADEPMVTVLRIYTLSGQLIKQTSLENLSDGVYVLQGLTRDGRLVTRKTVVTSQL